MPRRQKQFVARPSPLANVLNTRPISIDPTLGLVRDPQFWKRFSTAVHNQEAGKELTDLKEVDLEKNVGGSGSNDGVVGEDAGSGASAGTRSARTARSDTNTSYDSKNGTDWLAQQHKKKRKARCVCLNITLAVIIIAIAAVLVVLYCSGRL